MISFKIFERERLAEASLLLALLFIAFVAALVGLSWLGFVFGFRLTIVQPLLALLAIIGTTFFLGGKFTQLDASLRIFSLAVFGLTLALALFLCASVMDFTCDGQGYHGTGIMQLLEGWNPIRQPQHAEAPQALQREVMIHYAKGPWLAAGALARLTGKVEAGKATTLLLMAGCFFLALHTGLRHSRFGFGKALLVALLFAANPLTLSQCLTNYVDGQLAALFSFMFLGSCLLLIQSRAVYMLLVALAIVLLVNVKLTGLVYAGVFGISIIIVALLWKRAARTLVIVYSLAVLFGLAVGFNPYVTNLRETGNPFYPFAFGRLAPGGTEENFAVHQMPVVFRGSNRFENFARSIFSRCQNDYDLSALTFRGSPLKIPFTVGADEIGWFRNVDTRICGWGPLTSGILLFASAAIWFGCRRARHLALPLSLCLLATIFAIPHPWWARYAPQLWLLPVIVVAVLLLRQTKLANILAAILCGLMFSNLAMVAIPSFHTSYVETKRLQAQLRWLAAQHRTFPVAFGDFVFNRLRLREHGIAYRELPAFPTNGRQLTLAGENALASKTVVQLEAD